MCWHLLSILVNFMILLHHKYYENFESWWTTVRFSAGILSVSRISAGNLYLRANSAKPNISRIFHSAVIFHSVEKLRLGGLCRTDVQTLSIMTQDRSKWRRVVMDTLDTNGRKPMHGMKKTKWKEAWTAPLHDESCELVALRVWSDTQCYQSPSRLIPTKREPHPGNLQPQYSTAVTHCLLVATHYT